jgi:hypothetical protein
MRGEAELSADARAVLRDRYEAEIRDMDASLGRLVDGSVARAAEPAPAAAAPLRTLLDAHAARAPAAPVRAPEAVDAETLEALRALGYVE